VIVIGNATAQTAARQADWIATMEPWRSLGFSREGLTRFLRQSARRAGGVLLASAGKRGPALAIVCVQEGVLLGNFVALLAVKPEAAGQGIGRALMEAVAQQTFSTRRWLYVSVDNDNRAARAFYRKLRFRAVGRLPDLVRPGRVEILLRRAAPAADTKASPDQGAPARRTVRVRGRA